VNAHEAAWVILLSPFWVCYGLIGGYLLLMAHGKAFEAWGRRQERKNVKPYKYVPSVSEQIDQAVKLHHDTYRCPWCGFEVQLRTVLIPNMPLDEIRDQLYGQIQAHISIHGKYI
jgi:hypothetical protein